MVQNQNTPPQNPYPNLPPPPTTEVMDAYLDQQRIIIETSGVQEEAAATEMERMDHKIEHRRHIGQVALAKERTVVHRDTDGHPPGWRTRREKRLDKKAEQIGLELATKKVYADRYRGNAVVGSMTKREKSRAKRAVRKQSKKEHWSAQRTIDETQKINSAVTIPKRTNKLVKSTERKAKWSKERNERVTKRYVDSIPRYEKPRNHAIGRIQEAHAAAEQAQRNIDALT